MNIVILIFVLMLIIYGFIIIDLYPIWDDFKMRYIMKKSYKTNTSIDIHFNNLDTILNIYHSPLTKRGLLILF